MKLRLILYLPIDQFFMKYSKYLWSLSETMGCVGLKILMSDKHHMYYKHTKFCQNPTGDPKFLVDLTRNDPYIYCTYSPERSIFTAYNWQVNNKCITNFKAINIYNQSRSFTLTRCRDDRFYIITKNEQIFR